MTPRDICMFIGNFGQYELFLVSLLHKRLLRPNIYALARFGLPTFRIRITPDLAQFGPDSTLHPTVTKTTPIHPSISFAFLSLPCATFSSGSSLLRPVPILLYREQSAILLSFNVLNTLKCKDATMPSISRV